MSICENLLSIYNTNILNKVPEKEKFIWKTVCKFLNTKDKPNDKKEEKIYNFVKNITNHKKVLSSLIYNHFNLQKPNYRYISGPMNCSLWTSDIYKKNIYIFGETHGITESCSEYKETKGKYIEIQEYFKQLFITTDVFIDFYLEIQSFKKKEYKNFFNNMSNDTDFLNRVRKENYKCIEPETRNKLPECKLRRSHYINIRDYHIDNELFEFYEYICFNEDRYKNIYKYKNIIQKFNKTKDTLEIYILETYNNIVKNIVKNKPEKSTLMITVPDMSYLKIL